uniref:Uncharacterized protein n=1 Tax=Magallana gigas TaxID=29159 RepID=K1Q465_MAGGI
MSFRSEHQNAKDLGQTTCALEEMENGRGHRRGRRFNEQGKRTPTATKGTVVCIPTPEFNIVSFNSTLGCLRKSLSEINGVSRAFG